MYPRLTETGPLLIRCLVRHDVPDGATGPRYQLINHSINQREIRLLYGPSPAIRPQPHPNLSVTILHYSRAKSGVGRPGTPGESNERVGVIRLVYCPTTKDGPWRFGFATQWRTHCSQYKHAVLRRKYRVLTISSPRKSCTIQYNTTTGTELAYLHTRGKLRFGPALKKDLKFSGGTENTIRQSTTKLAARRLNLQPIIVQGTHEVVMYMAIVLCSSNKRRTMTRILCPDSLHPGSLHYILRICAPIGEGSIKWAPRGTRAARLTFRCCVKMAPPL